MKKKLFPAVRYYTSHVAAVEVLCASPTVNTDYAVIRGRQKFVFCTGKTIIFIFQCFIFRPKDEYTLSVSFIFRLHVRVGP